MKQKSRRKAKPRTRNRLSSPGVPVEELNLTLEERAMLPDPDIVTEDDADLIIARRRLAEDPKGTPWRKVLKEYGSKVQG